MERFARWVLRHPKKIVLFFLVLTLFFALEIRNLTINPAMDLFVPKGHPEVEFFREMKDVFGLLNFIIVGVVDEREGGIYREDTLTLIRDLTRSFQEIPDVIKVLSLFEFPYIEGDAEGMRVSPLLSEVPQDPDEIAQLKARIARWPLLTGTLVSADGKAAAFFVRYRKDGNSDLRRRVYHTVMDTIRPYEAMPQEVFVAGMTVIEVNISDYITRDMKRLFPLVFIVVIASLWFSFRRPLGVLLPLLTVIVSVIWTMGVMALLRVPLNTITSTLPVLLMAVGTAYTIHLLFHFFHNACQGMNPSEALVKSLSQVGYAVIMAGLTTIGGFASLVVSRVVPIRLFGIYAALGTLVALVSSLTLIPALLRLSLRRLSFASEPHLLWTGLPIPGLEEVLRGYTGWVLRHRRIVFGISAALAVFFLAGSLRIYPESDYITHFKRSSYIRKSDEMINRYFDGSSVLDIVVDGGAPDSLKDPDVLKRMDSLQAFAEGLPQVGGAMSLVDYLKRMNQVLNADAPAEYRIPDTREMIAQVLLLYSMSGDEADLEDVVNLDYSLACITVRLRTGSTRHAARMIAEIERYNREETRLSIHMTASMVLGKVVDDLTISGQIQSIWSSFLVVFGLVALIFRSFVGGFLAILPLLLCVIINFGILGWAGIPLQVGTALIASVAMGIGIDYAIHYLNIAKIRAQEGEDLGQGLKETAGTAGRAIIYNAAAVGLGFLVLVLSTFIADIYFGAFITLTMITASVATLTLIPCLVSAVRPRFLLGVKPQDPTSKIRLENDPRFLGRIESSRRSLRGGKGVRLEDI